VVTVVKNLLLTGLPLDNKGHITNYQFDCAHNVRMHILKTVQTNFFSSYKVWKKIDSDGKIPAHYTQPSEDVCEAATTKETFYAACRAIEVALVRNVDSCAKCKDGFRKKAGNIKELNLGDIINLELVSDLI
jgi:hypothetical protein